jgi:hypothetical protein
MITWNAFSSFIWQIGFLLFTNAINSILWMEPETQVLVMLHKTMAAPG